MDSLTEEFAELSPSSLAADKVLNLYVGILGQSELPPSLKQISHEFSDTETYDSISASSYTYKLSFNVLPKDFDQKEWIIGKGQDDERIDFVVAPAKQTTICAALSFHPRSGYLMLEAIDSRVLIKSEGKYVPFNKTCLASVENFFRFGTLEYCLKYTFNDPDHYVARRAVFIDKDLSYLHTNFIKFPEYSHSPVGDYMVHRKTVASGAFGFVSTGVHRVSGEPVAVKEVRMERSRAPQETIEEARICLLFKEKHKGILQTVGTMCEHEEEMPCGIYPERFFIITQLAFCDFGKEDWNSVSTEHRKARFRCILEGLCHLHQSGYIHRDITKRNLLILSKDEAVISDFGKMIHAKSTSGAGIGPAYTRAPEVWIGEYNSAIDIWSLGYAWLATYPGDISEPRQINKDTHSKIIAKIKRLEKDGEIDEKFSILLQNMLEWSASSRYTAPEALEYWRSHIEPNSESSSRTVTSQVSMPSSYFDGSESSSSYGNAHMALYDRTIRSLYERPPGFQFPPVLNTGTTTRGLKRRYHESSEAD